MSVTQGVKTCLDPLLPSACTRAAVQGGFLQELCQLPPWAFAPICLIGEILYSVSEPVNIASERLWKVGMTHREAAVWVPEHPAGQLEVPRYLFVIEMRLLPMEDAGFSKALHCKCLTIFTRGQWQWLCFSSQRWMIITKDDLRVKMTSKERQEMQYYFCFNSFNITPLPKADTYSLVGYFGF